MRYVVFPALTGGNECNRSAAQQQSTSGIPPTSGCPTQFCFADMHDLALLVDFKFYVSATQEDTNKLYLTTRTATIMYL